MLLTLAFLRRKSHIKMERMATPATPPTTPPAIAPELEWLVELLPPAESEVVGEEFDDLVWVGEVVFEVVVDVECGRAAISSQYYILDICVKN